MRRHDWPERLAAFLEARQGESFVWGESDCALFAADWVLEASVDGTEDPAALYRHRYDGSEGALGVLRRSVPRDVLERSSAAEEFGLGAFADLLAGAVTEALGPILASPREAQRGDVVALRDEIDPREIVLGIVLGVDVVVLDVARGLRRRPAAAAILAWRV